MGSTRLPGKVMMKLGDREALWHVCTRVSRCSLLDQVVVATSTHSRDDVIEEYSIEHGWCVFRGSEDDVLSRYRMAADATAATCIVRVTSDCPLIDPDVLARLVELMQYGYDYASTNYPRRTFPVGLDCEAMTLDALRRADREATDPYDREHVTPYFYRNPELFSIGGLRRETDASGIRLTLDTHVDYLQLQKIYDAFYQQGDIVNTSDAEAFFAASTDARTRRDRDR